MSISSARFAPLVYATMDLEEGSHGWLRLETALALLPTADGLGSPEVRCLDVSAVDDAGVIHVLSWDEEQEFKRRFVAAFKKRGGLDAVQSG